MPTPLRAQFQRIASLTTLFLAGCAGPPTDPARPMATAWHPARPDARGDVLFVLLPGRWDTRVDFTKHGFVDILRRHAPAADAVAVEATLPYYRDQTVVERLHREVIAPARARGYREVWLVGTSMGGLGSLFYLRDHPGEVAGLILLAPFVGDDRALFREIAAAGGARAWTPAPVQAESAGQPGDFQRELWRFLRALPPEPPIWVAFGESDRLRPGIEVFTTLLPAERVLRLPGGHDWKVWRAGFEQLLPRALP